jgi:hypothetical protein
MEGFWEPSSKPLGSLKILNSFKIAIFWDETPCILVDGYQCFWENWYLHIQARRMSLFYAEDRGTRFLPNVGTYPPIYTTSHPRWPTSWASPPWQLQILPIKLLHQLRTVNLSKHSLNREFSYLVKPWKSGFRRGTTARGDFDGLVPLYSKKLDTGCCTCHAEVTHASSRAQPACQPVAGVGNELTVCFPNEHPSSPHKVCVAAILQPY